MQWLEITINTSSEKMQSLCDRLEFLGISGLIIESEEDYRRFFEENKQYWDYIDEELDRSICGLCRVRFYLEDSEDGRRELASLSLQLPQCELIPRSVQDEDWENNWKQYYKPVEIGNRLLVVPSWEKTPEHGERTVLRLDPGLIFGTGTHPTTQMCLQLLETQVGKGERVLDLGCGSGILSLAALTMGAGYAVGVDIDPKAPDVVMENAALNDLHEDRLQVFAGDVLTDKKMQSLLSAEKFDLVLANIVADVIIALSPVAGKYLKETGRFICSGIIDGRQEEVETVLRGAGFRVLQHIQQENWHAYECALQ